MKEGTSYFFGALIIGLILLVFFTFTFLVDSRITGADYIGLVLITIISSLIIYFRDNVKEFNLREMKVILEHTREVKKEIDETTLSMIEIMAKQSAHSTGTWLNRKDLNDKIEKLLKNLNVDASKIKSILELPRIVEKMMKNGKESLKIEEQKMIDSSYKLEE
jgi:hypothetical protein